MQRRSALKILLAATCSGPVINALSGPQEAPSSRPAKSTAGGEKRMPVLFLAHGSPYLLDDAKWVGELSKWAGSLPRPKAILMISAHWERKPVTLGSTTTVPLVYDFSGFPQKYYDVKYAAPGAPALALDVRDLLKRSRIVHELSDRGLDHGAYVPLVAMYPKADVPVLQISLPTMDTPTLFELGRVLAPLRTKDVLIVGSGFLTHNLRAMVRSGAEPPAWSKEFDAWAADVLLRRDSDALIDYRYRAPGVREALPTHEHFVPVVVAMGAAVEASGAVTFPITGFTGGLTRRSVEFA
jgi:4,5-DOPA dioxygenase extradiol